MTTYSDAITIVHRLKVWIADERMGDGALLKAAADLIERQAAELAALRAQLAERKCERLRAQMKQMEKESREDLRSAAAEASWAERFPDEPYGTY